MKKVRINLGRAICGQVIGTVQPFNISIPRGHEIDKLDIPFGCEVVAVLEIRPENIKSVGIRKKKLF